MKGMLCAFVVSRARRFLLRGVTFPRQNSFGRYFLPTKRVQLFFACRKKKRNAWDHQFYIVTKLLLQIVFINHSQEVYISDIHRLDMVHMIYIMSNFDEVYINNIPPAVSIATWYISHNTQMLRFILDWLVLLCMRCISGPNITSATICSAAFRSSD